MTEGAQQHREYMLMGAPLVRYISNRLERFNLKNDQRVPTRAAIDSAVAYFGDLKAAIPLPRDINLGEGGNLVFEWRGQQREILLFISNDGTRKLQRIHENGSASAALVDPTADQLSETLLWFESGE